MKKLAFILILLISSLSFSSCEKEDPRPDCEIFSYGTVTIVNATGWDLFVDITWGGMEEYDTRLLLAKGSPTTYYEIPAGDIDIWASYDNLEWSVDEGGLFICEDLIFIWYLDDKKSSQKNLRLKVKRGDKEIELYPVQKTNRI